MEALRRFGYILFAAGIWPAGKQNREADMRAWSFALAAAVALPIAAQAEDAALKAVAARVEIHAIPSLTISDQQFLTGDANGKQVTVTGELRIAQAPAACRSSC